MNLIKKMILTTILTIGIVSFGFSIDFYYDYDNDISTNSEEQTKIGTIIKSDVIDSNDSSLNQLLKLFHLSQQEWYDSGNSKAIYYIKMIVNMLLSFVSLIALIMLIFAFYMMFFSKQESGMTKAKQMLKGIALALIIMGLSWFIVSFIFWIQSSSATSDKGASPIQNNTSNRVKPNVSNTTKINNGNIVPDKNLSPPTKNSTKTKIIK